MSRAICKTAYKFKLLIFLLSLNFIGGSSAIYPVSVITTIQLPAGSRPTCMVVNEGTKRLYAANYGGKSITIIDITTDQIIDRIDTDKSPGWLVPLPDWSKVYLGSADLL